MEKHWKPPSPRRHPPGHHPPHRPPTAAPAPGRRPPRPRRRCWPPAAAPKRSPRCRRRLACARAPPTRRILGAAGAPADAGPLPSADELLDWAERHYPEYFPTHASSLRESPYIYRYYPATGNYAGTAGNDVYVLGPMSGGVLLRVGSLVDFAPLVHATRYAYSDAAAARFLLHAQFGVRDEDIAAVRAQGYAAWLDAQFALPPGPTTWDWLAARGYGVVDKNLYYSGGAPFFDLAAYKQFFDAPDPLRKRIQQVLSELFSISFLSATLWWPHFVHATYWDGLGEQAFGNFRDMLEQVTLSAAMGAFLNIDGSQKENPATGRVPDENYAREVMQLYTIGLNRLNPDGSDQLDSRGKPIDSYSNDDVTQLARVFTGYTHDYSGPTVVAPVGGYILPTYPYAKRPMAFDATQHSSLEVRFLGSVIPAGTPGPQALKAALDTLFNHPNVGPFLGRQLIQRLVTSQPSPAYVARVSAAFADNGHGVRGDLRAVIKAVLLDEEARDASGLAAPTFGKLREPALRFVQWGRTFRLASISGSWKYSLDYGNPAFFFGQRLFWSPSVFNFFRPGYVPPNTALATTASTAPEFQIVNEASVAQYINALEIQLLDGPYIFAPDRPDIDQTVPSSQSGVGDMSPDYSREIALAHDASALVDRLSLLLSAGQLSASTRARIVAALSTFPVNINSPERTKRGRVAQALLMTMVCPEYLVQK
ncbi:MAG: DUF1800 domain-containing protein [Burkholderiales bacterium]|nr:DUF1800 domain-containing protein [Burkholderiales bacterium]